MPYSTGGREPFIHAPSLRLCAKVDDIVNYTKSRKPFRQTVTIEPLVNAYGVSSH